MSDNIAKGAQIMKMQMRLDDANGIPRKNRSGTLAPHVWYMVVWYSNGTVVVHEGSTSHSRQKLKLKDNKKAKAIGWIYLGKSTVDSDQVISACGNPNPEELQNLKDMVKALKNEMAWVHNALQALNHHKPLCPLVDLLFRWSTSGIERYLFGAPDAPEDHSNLSSRISQVRADLEKYYHNLVLTMTSCTDPEDNPNSHLRYNRFGLVKLIADVVHEGNLKPIQAGSVNLTEFIISSIIAVLVSVSTFTAVDDNDPIHDMLRYIKKLPMNQTGNFAMRILESAFDWYLGSHPYLIKLPSQDIGGPKYKNITPISTPTLNDKSDANQSSLYLILVPLLAEMKHQYLVKQGIFTGGATFDQEANDQLCNEVYNELDRMFPSSDDSDSDSDDSDIDPYDVDSDDEDNHIKPRRVKENGRPVRAALETAGVDKTKPMVYSVLNIGLGGLVESLITYLLTQERIKADPSSGLRATERHSNPWTCLCVTFAVLFMIFGSPDVVNTIHSNHIREINEGKEAKCDIGTSSALGTWIEEYKQSKQSSTGTGTGKLKKTPNKQTQAKKDDTKPPNFNLQFNPKAYVSVSKTHMGYTVKTPPTSTPHAMDSRSGDNGPKHEIQSPEPSLPITQTIDRGMRGLRLTHAAVLSHKRTHYAMRKSNPIDPTDQTN